MPHIIEQKRYLSFPPPKPPLPRWRRVVRNLWGLAVMPGALLTARLRGAPGLGIRSRCTRLGLRAWASDRGFGYTLMANPLDSVRYFELDFVRSLTRHVRIGSYLDVSSPRLVPLMLLDSHKQLVADLINPIGEDLQGTASLAKALRLSGRCRMQQVLLEDAGFEPDSFDLITSISVVEHIPDDHEAIAKMWRLLRPGGRLLVTVPCAAKACEEYTNLDEYKLIEASEGYVYWQRYYDEEALAARIWSITGSPRQMRIFGEVRSGIYDENVHQKRTDPAYRFWWEPVMMGRDFRYFDRLEDLPGMGVVGMEFVKPDDSDRG